MGHFLQQRIFHLGDRRSAKRIMDSIAELPNLPGVILLLASDMQRWSFQERT
jgi:hypothetical protein